MSPPVMERARAYIAKMPISIEGQGGSAAAFNVAVALTRGFGLIEVEALHLIQEWNAGCLPPWSGGELRHKVRNALASSTKPMGYLLGESEYSAPKTTPDFESEDERKARQRQSWPPFKPLTMAGMKTVARLRNLPVEAVITAARNGFLSDGIVDGHKCFVIRDGTFAQAIRLDGGLLETKHGPTGKKNLHGSQGAFIGHGKWLGDVSVNVLLVEGAVGFLEAIAAHHITEPSSGWTVIAATSAGSRFSRDPALLATLKGRRVVIIPDADEAGHDGACSWLADLECAGATVMALQMPDGCKDLGPIVAAPERYRETLNCIFQ